MITLLTYCRRRHDVNTSHENIDRFHLALKKSGVDLLISSDYLDLGIPLIHFYSYSPSFSLFLIPLLLPVSIKLLLLRQPLSSSIHTSSFNYARAFYRSPRFSSLLGEYQNIATQIVLKYYYSDKYSPLLLTLPDSIQRKLYSTPLALGSRAHYPGTAR